MTAKEIISAAIQINKRSFETGEGSAMDQFDILVNAVEKYNVKSDTEKEDDWCSKHTLPSHFEPCIIEIETDVQGLNDYLKTLPITRSEIPHPFKKLTLVTGYYDVRYSKWVFKDFILIEAFQEMKRWKY